ncbi:substrate-binding domain-containing protein [Nocardiopsis kunsanensis]|uniref:substrate-binding domain-containing protein n=1 Tax=Nocardiopsis kunsanensis TaxID=141693 RepID=UPI00034DF225|nr:substrate-binding domain-containing protein [Nocardiopsis kunsanensis]
MGRVDNLNAELSVHDPEELPALLRSRSVDVVVGSALGSRPGTGPAITGRTILDFEMVTVPAPGHPLARRRIDEGCMREHTWPLGPSAKARYGTVPSTLRRFRIPAHRQRVFQSHAAALDRVRQGEGVGLARGFAVSRDLASGSLVTPPRADRPRAPGIPGLPRP